jgi:hypothetical protein
MINVISLGVGKQSTYMLINALKGSYQFKPNYAIFSDTGCEPKYVYEYLDYLKDYLRSVYNFEITEVKYGNIKEDTLNYINGNRLKNPQIPLRLSGSGGILNRQCTEDYKIMPLRREIQRIRVKQKVRLWIGISLDEIERVKQSNVNYIEHYYPLIENRISLHQIISWYKKEGIKEPGKSACLICPFHSDSYWKTFKKQFPDEFETACKFDDSIRKYPKIERNVYLSKHLKPLRDINFDQQNSLFPELIEECHGLCGL